MAYEIVIISRGVGNVGIHPLPKMAQEAPRDMNLLYKHPKGF